MKPSLTLKMGQQLTLTPQLQQAIRLLQLSTPELQQEIQEALESNPLLELREENDDEDFDQTADVESPPSAQIETIPSINDTLEDETWNERIPSELPIDTAWEDIYQTSATHLPTDSDDNWDITTQTCSGENLQEHLLWQINLSHLSETDRIIALTLIDSINQDGYLEDTLEDIQQTLPPELEVELDEILMVLHRIQQLEPAGVGARNLSECLTLQLKQLPVETPYRQQAQQMVTDHLELLGHHDITQLMRRMKLPEQDLRQTICLIQKLNPRPGSAIEVSEPEYIVPDVIVRKTADHWRVELNQEAMPRLRINPTYANLIRRADSSDDNTFLRNQLQEARWFIKSLQSRNETLMKVASKIVEHQRDFFEYGEEAMKPLILHDIAEVVGLHESTVSRVTTQKYMHTPRGNFELKYFFSSHVSTTAGGECSSTAIRAMIKKLISSENAKKPLSDNKIAGLLEAQGIQVARRTIAKYRESLGIAPSSERKRLV